MSNDQARSTAVWSRARTEEDDSKVALASGETMAANAAAETTGPGGARTAAVAAVAVVAALGVFAVASTSLAVWAMWMNDPLKSVGMFVPVVSLVLILRAWKSQGWQMHGSWWGLVLLAVTVGAVHLREHAILELVLTPSVALFLPPHSLVAVLYAAGFVLLFGGVQLLRRVKFPVLLMALVNPVPHLFNVWVDLPLQRVSAHVARGFAHMLGQPLTNDQMRLMFTPEFGMFIAPGCNGIRGAVTMGLIALIAGYVYGFRPRVWALVVAAAVGLGYVFNFARLCTLVLYYLVALKIEWLQSRATMGDYIIGACLFFIATWLLFLAIQRLSVHRSLRPPSLPVERDEAPAGAPSVWVRVAACAVLVVAAGTGDARAMLTAKQQPSVADPALAAKFPQQVGAYKLVRTWNEYLPGGGLIFVWADYKNEAASGEQGVVSVGVSPVLGTHDTLLCHAARGEDWLWHGNLNFATAGGSEGFSGSFYNTGATQYLEATTICAGGSCGQYNTGEKSFGLVYSKPDVGSLLERSPSRPMPVLLKAETLNTSMSADGARSLLTGEMAEFLKQARLAEFTAPFR